MIKTKSGGKLVKINRQWIVGEGTINDIQTSQIENMNGIARGYQSILVRKTKSFAKKIDRVDMMYELFQVYRNFMKQDKTKKIYSGYLQRSITQTTFDNFIKNPNEWVPNCPKCGSKMMNLLKKMKHLETNYQIGSTQCLAIATINLNRYTPQLCCGWDKEYVKTVYGSLEKIPVMFSKVSYEMFKDERKRFYSERRGRIIRLKHDDS